MLKGKIESLLFISNKPLTDKWIANFLSKNDEKVSAKQVKEILDGLVAEYNIPDCGINIIQTENEYQMVTNPEASDLVKKFLKDDLTGELTPASLEALTVIAYRGPISKPELEQIRGVNCSLILRNLLIRGLITMEEDKTGLQKFYRITTDFLKHLGLNKKEELPDFERLHRVENLEEYLEKAENE